MRNFKDIPLNMLVKRIKVGFVGSIEKFYCSKEDGVLLLRTNNLTEKGIEYSDVKYVTEEFHNRNQKSQLRKNDILIARHGDNGRASIYEGDEPAQALNVVIIEPDNSKISSWLIKYFFESPYVQNQIHAGVGGSVQGVINTKQISELLIPIDERIEYKRVENILKAIENKIKNNNKINDELEPMAKMIYDYWFLQFEFPNEEGKPYKSSGGKMVWNEELKREIPEGWKVVRIGELFTSSRGISYNSKEIEKNGIPMINLASFKPGGGYKVEGIKKYSGNYEAEKILKPYDLVMCNTQQTAIDFSKDIIGKAFLVPDIFDSDIVSSHHVTKLSVESESLKYYLYRLFCTDYFHKYIAGFTNGTNILGLLFNGVEDYRSEIPDEKVLQKFALIISDIEQKKNEIIKENQELAALRDFLLPLLMNGQIGFKDN